MKKYFCIFGIMFIFLAGCSKDVSKISDMPEETNVLNIQNENAHKAYKSAMKKSNNNINHIDDNGVFQNPYAYYDIDEDGIDELIVNGGYFAYRVFTYQNGELIDLWSSKYGGNEIQIYPDRGVVFFSSGHMDYYTDTYIKIFESKVEKVAEKSGYVKHLSETKSRTENKYSVMGISVKKSKYVAYVKSLRKEKVVTHNQLEWRNK